MWPFTTKSYEKIIRHQDWCDYDGDAAIKITPKEHKCGKRPFVIIDGPKVAYSTILIDGTIMIYRGLPIWQGTLFTIKVTISK